MDCCTLARTRGGGNMDCCTLARTRRGGQYGLLYISKD